jgi:hypothetical protein
VIRPVASPKNLRAVPQLEAGRPGFVEALRRRRIPVLGMSPLSELMMPRQGFNHYLDKRDRGRLGSTASHGHPMNSTLLHWEVTESVERLVAALAEEQKANDLGATNPKDATIRVRWRTARQKVLRAADYYVSALDNYLEAVLSAVTHGKPGGPGLPTLSAESRKPELAADLTRNYRTRTVRRCRPSIHRPPSPPAVPATVERCVTADISLVGGGEPKGRTAKVAYTRSK